MALDKVNLLSKLSEYSSREEVMNKITHMVDKDGKVVIDATWDNNTFGAVLVPNVKGDIPHIKKSSINTKGVDNSKEFKERIISVITTQWGKNGETPLVVEDDEKG